jgi:NADH-quinone oxidoreductase subunit M
MVDLEPREIAIFAPLILVVLWMGIYPNSFLHVTSASVQNLIENYQTALADAPGVRVAAK